jgi:hypothetical protein
MNNYSMKRIPEITLFIILMLVLLSSGIIIKNDKSSIHLKSPATTGHDTTNLSQLIVVDSFRLRILPPSSGVQFYKNDILFLSMSKYERKMTPNQISFGMVEAYYAFFEDSVEGKHLKFSPLSSFSYPCEAMTFSHNFDTVYFTKFPKKDKKEKIYMARFVPDSDGRTGLTEESIPLDFCADNYTYSHPTLSSDGKMMVFASDREGSFGGMDLFISRLSNGKWSSPENLGKLINTPGNEFFPFLDSENNLFFSSDMLPGYGGYDIFSCKFNGVNWDKPINLSQQINSDKDDIAFTINKMDGKTAFFTRRQKTDKDDMQLFRVKLKQDIADRNLLTLSSVFNGKPVPKTSVIATLPDNKVKLTNEESPRTKPRTEDTKTNAAKVSERNTKIKSTTEKTTVAKSETNIRPVENKVTPIKKPVPTVAGQKDVVIYRVQLLPGTSQKKSKEMIINGTKYKIYEYVYLGAPRYTIGEFSTLAPATALQNMCRQSGYPQSFVVAFKNDTRSLDVNIFK